MLRINLTSTTARPVDATSWGIEEGLTYLLEGDNLLGDAVNIDRVIASAARRDRYARLLLAKNIVTRAEVYDTAGQIEARSSLVALQQRMPPDKLGILVDLAIGTDPAHLAAKHGIVVGALRTRISRARQVARDIAA